jgi:hypothetical protein
MDSAGTLNSTPIHAISIVYDLWPISLDVAGLDRYQSWPKTLSPVCRPLQIEILRNLSPFLYGKETGKVFVYVKVSS